jgi:hypothetical protein
MTENANTQALGVSADRPRSFDPIASMPLRVVHLAIMSEMPPRASYSTSEDHIPLELRDYADDGARESLAETRIRQDRAGRWLMKYLARLEELLQALPQTMDQQGLTIIRDLIEGTGKEMRCCQLAAEAANGAGVRARWRDHGRISGALAVGCQPSVSG